MKIFFTALLIFSTSLAQALCLPAGSPDVPLTQTAQALIKKLAFPKLGPQFCEAINVCDNPSAKGDTSCNRAETLQNFTHDLILARKFGTCGLSEEEMVALYFYTATGFECMNNYLREPGPKDAPPQYLVSTLNKALSKLPSYKGLVRRGANLPGFAIAQHKKGEVVEYKAFTSSSTGGGFYLQDNFLIYSSSGKPIMGLAANWTENEVLFATGAKFKVLEVFKKKNKNYYIMKEVAETVTDQEILNLVKETKLSMPKPDHWECPQDSVGLPASIPQLNSPPLYEFK
jgi:NAD:arginine ADP-ribosyltransferase